MKRFYIFALIIVILSVFSSYKTDYFHKGIKITNNEFESNITIQVNGVSFNMKFVEGGTFEMGETEVTKELWQAVTGNNPSYYSGVNLPVERVSWNDIVNVFLPMLNELTGMNFRLPTESEWEYAARGGNRSRGYKYAGSDTLDDVAWYDGSSNDMTHAVKTKSPNELGLYDMSGNVFEWCSDWFGDYSARSQSNPTGPSSGERHVLRGSGWSDVAWGCPVNRILSNSSRRVQALISMSKNWTISCF